MANVTEAKLRYPVFAYYFFCRLQKVCQQAFSIYFWSMSGFWKPFLSVPLFVT